ncbi:hypothetical protein GCM10010415_65940 [Streptomyces atrovirens]
MEVLRGLGEEDCGAIAVADVGRAGAGERDGATGVGQEMAFDAADLLAAVAAMRPPRSVARTLRLSTQELAL